MINRLATNLAVTLILLGAISGCAATVGLASAEADQAAKLFIPPQGNAGVYISRRQQFTGSAVLFQVLVDGRSEGGIAPGTYHFTSVAPGMHTVTATSGENQSVQQIDAVAGGNYFFEVRPRWGMMTARVELVPLSEEEGREAVSANSLAQDLTPD